MASQTIAGHELQYTQDNLHAFAYSGVVTLGGSMADYLNFTTGDGYILGEVKISADWAGLGGDELYMQFLLNDVMVMYERDTGGNFVPGNTTWPVLLPPFSKFQVQLSAGGAQEGSAIFVGKVYEYLPVRN